MSFTKTKNGYCEKEKLINELKSEVDSVKKQEHSIAIALTAAVDKAKEIEISSKNIYRLKIEQMTILCSKWETLLSEMIKKYPGIEDVTNVKEDINNLKSIIKKALKDDFNIDLISKTPVTDPIRILLSRLNEVKSNAVEREKPKINLVRKNKVSLNDRTELSKLEERTNQIKPIVNLNLKKDDVYENLVDKFLNTDDEQDMSKIIKNSEEKFDLNEAVNPTEDLEEIMKAFDFYKKK